MTNPAGANQYKRTAVQTANPGQVLIMLYEAAIKYVKKASVCIDAKDIPGKGQNIGRVHDILNELTNTLNFEVGGKIAHDLEALYNFMIGQLVKANAENDKAALEVVQKNLETLLAGWRVAVEQVQQGQAKK